jgi:hypothetical protein
MHRRGMETTPVCQICGTEQEDTFHTFITCQPARNMWGAMRSIWSLPRENEITNTGTEWLIHLLPRLTEMQRAMTLMALWRVWHIHNEITHAKPMSSVESSKRFLASYLDSLVMIKQDPNADMLKGKSVVSYDQGFTCNTKVCDGRQKNNVKWLPPEEGMAKLNTDGSFVSMNEAGAGMVLRD